LLAQAEGASDILHRGFTTYTKEHKSKVLGVSERLIKEQFGVCPTMSFWKKPFAALDLIEHSASALP